MMRLISAVLCISFIFTLLCSCSSNSNNIASDVASTKEVETQEIEETQEVVESKVTETEKYIVVPAEELYSLLKNMEPQNNDSDDKILIELTGIVKAIYNKDKYFVLEVSYYDEQENIQISNDVYCYDNSGLCYAEMPLLEWDDSVKVQGEYYGINENDDIVMGLHSIEFID